MKDAKHREAAKGTGVDQLIYIRVFKTVRRAGVPIARTMAMVVILAGGKANARLVAQGFTGLGLSKTRAEAPALSIMGRQCILQLAWSHARKLEVGDASTDACKAAAQIKAVSSASNLRLSSEHD